MAICEGLPGPWHKIIGGDGKTFLEASGEEHIACSPLTLPRSGASEKRGNTMEVRTQVHKSQWKDKS